MNILDLCVRHYRAGNASRWKAAAVAGLMVEAQMGAELAGALRVGMDMVYLMAQAHEAYCGIQAAHTGRRTERALLRECRKVFGLSVWALAGRLMRHHDAHPWELGADLILALETGAKGQAVCQQWREQYGATGEPRPYSPMRLANMSADIFERADMETDEQVARHLKNAAVELGRASKAKEKGH